MPTITLSDARRLARRFQALADPTRLEILERLRRGEHCVCELQAHLEAAQSRLSFHLRTLKEAGLILDRREGRWMYYRINPDAVAELSAALAAAAHAETGRLCCR